MKVVMTVALCVVIIIAGLNIARNFDELRARLIWRKLEATQARVPVRFSADMVKDLPGPARRYFEYTILEGTPLKSTVKLNMTGKFGLGPKEAPGYMDMIASQIMTFPDGFVWTVKTGRGPMVLTGSDGVYQDTSWSQFWLTYTLPVARAGGRSKQSEDHRCSAFGRLVSESVFWSPASLLPSESVHWEAVDDTTARATVHYGNLVQTVDVTVNDLGQPVEVVIPRWSDSNSDNIYQLQPFGGYLSDFKEFFGYRLPTHVEGGNFIGEEGYYPFYIADVKSVAFLD